MQNKIIGDILLKKQLFHTIVYSSFLSLPNNLLDSDEKIILIEFMVLSCLTISFPAGLDIELNDISKLTGIPYGTIARKITNLEKKIPYINKWIDEHTSLGEKINFFSRKEKSNHKIYHFVYSQPRKDLILNANINKPNRKDTKEFNEKLAILLKTGLDKDTLIHHTKYSIDRIERNVNYFIHAQELKENSNNGEELGPGYLSSCLSHDWGKGYLSDPEKLKLYFDLINKIIAGLPVQLEKLKLNVKQSHNSKYKGPHLSEFKNKSAFISFFNKEINLLSSEQLKYLNYLTYDVYNNFIKSDLDFAGKTETKVKEMVRIAFLQWKYNFITVNEIKKAA
ncbi:MAG: hypothetical protein EHM58_04395 [Ignavibacteriae bacterium]|nr:MAG: hypothetical protein EHM58_04395 [Ignavibacteriota bacterium]